MDRVILAPAPFEVSASLFHYLTDPDAIAEEVDGHNDLDHLVELASAVREALTAIRT